MGSVPAGGEPLTVELHDAVSNGKNAVIQGRSRKPVVQIARRDSIQAITHILAWRAKVTPVAVDMRRIRQREMLMRLDGFGAESFGGKSKASVTS